MNRLSLAAAGRRGSQQRRLLSSLRLVPVPTAQLVARDVLLHSGERRTGTATSHHVFHSGPGWCGCWKTGFPAFTVQLGSEFGDGQLFGLHTPRASVIPFD
jgi:hypothetical protein